MNAFIWAILTALVWGVVPLVEKAGLGKIDPLVGLFYRCGGVLIGIALLLVFQGASIRQSFHQLHSGMLFLILGGFLASIVGQVFFYHALKTGETSIVVPLASIYPLVTFVLALLFFGEEFTLAKLAGIGSILLGVFLLK